VKLSRINVLDRMRLWQKFLLLGVFALAAVLFPFYRYIGQAESEVQFARDEQAGISPIVAIAKLVQSVQQHRGLSANMLGGVAGAAQLRTQKEAEIGQLFAQADRLVAAEDFARMRDDWAGIRKDWKSLADSVSQRRIDARASNQAHAEFIERLLLAIEQIADLSKLSLDPAAHTYFLMNSFTVQLPKLTENLGQARAQGAAILADAARLRASGADPAQAISDADRVRLVTTLRNVQSNAEDTRRFLSKVFREEPRLKERIQSEMAAPMDQLEQLVQLSQKEVIDAHPPSFDPTRYLGLFTQGIDAQFKLLYSIAQLMNNELDLQIAEKRRAEFVISAQIVAALVVAAMVGLLTVLNVRRTVNRLQSSVDQVRAGDIAALQNIEAKDEVGDLGRTINELLTDRLAAQQKAEQENEALNSSVIQLLQAVHQLSQRDLTTRAPVTQDVIGTVSDSINSLAEETSRVLQSVSHIAGQVAQASGNVRSQAELVSQTAQDERSSIEQMVETLAQATQTMSRVTQLAEQSNQSATQATQATDTALQTVDGTVKGMESIRETIAETEKRIKRLGERSQEISGIVNLINTISERTHVLALNASMQAAVAGEAGRGFAVVAEEVQRLAESSRNATQQIATLVNNIQVETNETISTVNRTIGQVVEGSGLAQKAGEQMRRTQQITAELVANVKRISSASEEQKETSDRLMAAARQIGESTQRTGQQIDTQNRETETLLQSARHLLDSVNVFKLPQAA
jgi:methyl-accepting chemotaxis protein